MGWNSAGPIFDAVARPVIICSATDREKKVILVRLIEYLQSNDWDTEDESLYDWQDYPVAVAAFAQCGITLDDNE